MPPIETDNNSDLTQDTALLESEEGNSPVTEVKETKVKAPDEIPLDELDEKPEVEEDDELDEELEEKEEEEKEILPHERPTLKQIKEKFPDFFKTFPTLKAAINRERQFSEIFHTPQEASDSAKLAEDYRVFQSDVVNGSGEKLLPALKESNSLGKFSKSFLSNLYKTDKDLHYQTILPVIEDVLRVAFRDGKSANNENLLNAALVVSQHILGDPSIAEGKRSLVEKEIEPDKKVSEERAQLDRDRYNEFNISANEVLFNTLIKQVNNGFKEEDGLTNFMKEAIRKKVIEDAMNTARADKLHMKYIDRLWSEAKSNRYRTEDKARITNAWLARVKSLIPSLRRQMITEAIGSSPKELQRKQSITQQQTQRREPGSQGRPGQVVNRAPTSKQIDWKKTSDVDLLNDKITLKRT